MKKPLVVFTLSILAVFCLLAATTTVSPGKRIKDYPVNDNPSTNARYIMEKGDFSTNENISHGRLTFLFTNALTAALNSKASTNTTIIISNLVTTTSNFLYSTSFFAGSNLVVVLSGTNTLVQMTSTNGTNFYKVNADDSVANAIISNALVTFTITTSNFLASSNAFSGSNLVVVLPATNTTVVMTSTNGTNFYAVSSTASASASSIGFQTNQFTTNIASTPVNGRVWFQGFPGVAFSTNNARNRTWEWDPTNQSVRIGSIGNVGIDQHTTIAASNYWDSPNIGFMSWCFGSNNLANATNSVITGGTRNLIYTNASGSFIGAGTGHAIHTNSRGSVIVGGGVGASAGNIIEVNSELSFIGGGSDHRIDGGSPNGVVVGGQANQIRGGNNSYGFIGGGLNNTVISGVAGGSEKAVIVGGELNTLRGDHAVMVGGRANTFQASGCDYSIIVGGEGSTIGAGGFPSTRTFIGGGASHLIEDSSDYAIISGGRNNTIAAPGTNGVISGGAFNTTTGAKFSFISGGERNLISGNYSFSVGSSNNVTVARSGAIGNNVTNNVADTVVVGNLVDYRQVTVVAGAGTGSTNYTLQAISPMSYLGSSNVNIVAVMQTVPGRVHRWSVNITNLSADNWGFSFPNTTNRVKWQSWMYGTNAPTTLTNNTILKLDGVSEGTNTLVEYKYFSPAL